MKYHSTLPVWFVCVCFCKQIDHMEPLKEKEKQKRLLLISLFQLLISLFLSIYFLSKYLYSKPANYLPPPISAQTKPPHSVSFYLEILLKFILWVNKRILVQPHCVNTRLMQWSDFSPMLIPLHDTWNLIYMTHLWKSCTPKTAFITPIPSQRFAVPPHCL